MVSMVNIRSLFATFFFIISALRGADVGGLSDLKAFQKREVMTIILNNNNLEYILIKRFYIVSISEYL